MSLRMLAWVIQHNNRGVYWDTLCFLEEGNVPKTKEEWARVPWLDEPELRRKISHVEIQKEVEEVLSKYTNLDDSRLCELVVSMRDRIIEQQEHLDTFCKCPSHGPSLIQIPEGEFDPPPPTPEPSEGEFVKKSGEPTKKKRKKVKKFCPECNQRNGHHKDCVFWGEEDATAESGIR